MGKIKILAVAAGSLLVVGLSYRLWTLDREVAVLRERVVAGERAELFAQFNAKSCVPPQRAFQNGIKFKLCEQKEIGEIEIRVEADSVTINDSKDSFVFHIDEPIVFSFIDDRQNNKNLFRCAMTKPIAMPKNEHKKEGQFSQFSVNIFCSLEP